jgi:hypothetical protein
MSAVGPFDVLPVIARIRNQATGFRDVGGAADRAAVQTGTTPMPAAYVMLGDERPTPKAGAGGGSQIQSVTATFGVLIALRDYRVSGRGATVFDPLNTLIAAVRGAMLGWSPDAYHTGTEMAGARLQSYDASVLWWLETYRTTYFARSS